MKLPDLDDKTYGELVAEAIAQIPLECPEWTDHNPSDTGIILIELLAWLTEMTLYQVNQIPEKNYAKFLGLLNGKQGELNKSLSSDIQTTLQELRRPYRAVTLEDYERLILEDWNQSPECKEVKIARVKGIAQRNLETSDMNTFAQGHISLVVVPQTQNGNNNYKDLLDFLEQRKLLTTQIHIVEPSYISVTITAKLVMRDGAKAEKVQENAKEEVKMFFDPLKSGKYWEGKGWPFGRGIYLSDLYKILDDLEGVDYVNDLQIKTKNDQSETILTDHPLDDKQPKMTQFYLTDNQLVSFSSQDSKFTIIVEVGNERKSI